MVTARTRGAWAASDTQAVILDAACECLGERAIRGDIGLEVSEVLARANELWDHRYGLVPGAARQLTRGAITSQWRTVRQLEEQAVLAWFEKDLVRVPAVGRAASEVLAAALMRSPKEGRRAIRAALAELVRTTILGDNDRVQWTMRFLALRYHSNAQLRVRHQQAYAERRHHLLPLYHFAVRAAGWRIPPKRLLDMHLALIDGSLSQLSVNQTRQDDLVADNAATAVDLLCRGLPRRTPKVDSRAARLLRELAQREGSWGGSLSSEEFAALGAW